MMVFKTAMRNGPSFCVGVTVTIVLFLSIGYTSSFLLPTRSSTVSSIRNSGQASIGVTPFTRFGSNQDDDEASMLNKASKLREEAELLQKQLETKRTSSADNQNVKKAIPSPVNKRLNDSTWSINYRFSSQPAKSSDDNSEDGSSEKATMNVYYSGSFKIYFKSDGYSELVSHEGTGGSTVEIVKAWGWDRETSNDDGLDYVLWSMDVKLPKSDPQLPSQTERFYLQARVDQIEAPQEGLSLKDGTVTVKQDVADRTGGVWGLFSVKGILTEFKYVGDFAARPAPATR